MSPHQLGHVPVSSYEDLAVWQRGMELVVRIYEIARRLPTTERYGLAAQMRRAAVSIPANVAEAHGRRHIGDKLRFLSIANGSLKELETEVKIMSRLGFLPNQEARDFAVGSEELGRMLAGLMRSLRRRVVPTATRHLPPAT